MSNIKLFQFFLKVKQFFSKCGKSIDKSISNMCKRSRKSYL